MDELEELQRQLQEVQNEAETHKFSERNVVELMDRLVDLQKLELLHSMNGKEYLTSEHLATEILRELQKNGGRLDTIELPKLLDVSGDHIHKQIDALIRKDKRRLTSVNDSLLSNGYLDSVTLDISSILAEHGSISLSEISSMHDLPLDFLRIKFAEWIDNEKIKGKMHGGMVYNDLYIRREKCRIRGYIMGTSRPVAISQAIADLKIEDRLFNSLLEELLKEDAVKAKLQSDLIIPACFEETQKNIILSFYIQNHYVEYSKLTKIMIRKPKEYLKSLKLEGVYLSTVFVDNSLIVQVDSCIGDILNSDQIFDLHTQLPECFTEDDLKEFIGKCTGGAKGVLIGHHIAGKKFIEDCFEELKRLAKEYAKTAKQPKKEAKKAAALPKKKKAKAESAQEDEKIALAFSEETAKNELKKCERLLKDKLDQDDELVDAFIEAFYSDIRETYIETYKDYMKEKLEPQKINSEQFTDEIQKEFDKLQTAVKALDTIAKLMKGTSQEQQKKVETILIVHLIKKQVNPLFNYFVVLQLAHMGVNVKEYIKDKSIPSLTVQERDKLLKKIPKTFEKVFTELNKFVAGKDVKGFLESILEHKGEMAVILRPTDKKADRLAKNSLIQTYKAALASETEDLKSILYNALSLEMVENCIIISLPNETWAIELMGTIAKATGKVDTTIVEAAESIKAYTDILKVEEDERSELQIKFMKDFEAQKEGVIKEVLELYKPKE